MRRALICRISGKDGAYLARSLLKRGYQVFGTSRDATSATFDNLKRLGVQDRVDLVSMASKDFRSVLRAVEWATPMKYTHWLVRVL